MGLFSVVSLTFHQSTSAKGRPPKPRSYPWYAKTEVTFSDALAAVRRQFWQQTVFSEVDSHGALNKLPRKLRETLLDHLTLAA